MTCLSFIFELSSLISTHTPSPYGYSQLLENYVFFYYG